LYQQERRERTEDSKRKGKDVRWVTQGGGKRGGEFSSRGEDYVRTTFEGGEQAVSGNAERKREKESTKRAGSVRGPNGLPCPLLDRGSTVALAGKRSVGEKGGRCRAAKRE